MLLVTMLEYGILLLTNLIQRERERENLSSNLKTAIFLKGTCGLIVDNVEVQKVLKGA